MAAKIRWVLKRVGWGVAVLLTFPWAVLAGFGHFKGGFRFFAQTLSLIPGLPGSYARAAYYWMTLRASSLEIHVGLGSFFTDPQVSVGHRVYIGAYCILGRTRIGERAQLASGVQLLSGSHQHSRGPEGEILGSEQGVFEEIPLGADCWIGAGAIVMAEVGEGTTIGAGAVVTRPIPARSVAVGNPARVIKSS